jgi:hypothetical protein
MKPLDKFERRLSLWWPILLAIVGTLVGTGSVITLNNETNSRQDSQLSQLRLELKSLSDDVRATREAVIRIESKL